MGFAVPSWWHAMQAFVAKLAAAEEFARGPRKVTVQLLRGETELTLELVPGEAPSEADQATLARFLRCTRSARSKSMHPGLVQLIIDVAARYPGHAIEITSAYRATREERRTSPHRAARAVDFRVLGVKTTEVRDWLWATHRNQDGVGVGWYPHGDFLHMDVRPGKHDATWTQKHMNDDNTYNPRWARVVKAPTPTPEPAP